MILNKYSNALIYTIRCKTDKNKIYVGSTYLDNINKRFNAHKHNCRKERCGSLYSHIIDNNWDDWYIEIYEKYPCNNRKELRKREGEVILDISTINKNVAGRSNKDSKLNWWANNPNYKKEWISKNKEHLKNYNKLYYAKKQLNKIKN